MHHPPVSPQPFRYSIPDPFDPVKVAVNTCLKAAFLLSALYALGMGVYITWLLWTPDTVDLRDGGSLAFHMARFYAGAGGIAVLSGLVGLAPALIAGSVGGSLIGRCFRYRKQPFPSHVALWYGALLSLFLTGTLCSVGLFFDFHRIFESPFDLWIVALWYGPLTLSFFGFWWTVYQVNRKLPSSLR